MNGIAPDKNIGPSLDGTWKPKPALPKVITGKDTGFALVMLVIGFLFWNLIPPGSLGAGVTLFAVIICIASGGYLHISGLKQGRASLVCLAVILLSSTYFLLSDSIIIKNLNFLFLMAGFIYWICLTTGNRMEKRLAFSFLYDMINQSILIPFSNFSCCFAAFKSRVGENKRGKGIVSGAAGILIFLPVLILVVNLLIDADAAFESFIENLRFSFSADLLEYLLQMILGIPVACYLYGMIYGNRYKRYTDHLTLESAEKNVMAFRFAPDTPVYSALTALNLIYLVFFLTQAAYLFSAFTSSIPAAMTYAEYARRGFFELCTVAGINLAVIAVAHAIIKREKEEKQKLLKAETLAICFFTILLIATAMSKMAMYIESYGLTQLRVYTSWFMILLLAVFGVIAARQFKKFNGTKIVIISFVILFFVLCYGNVDGMIAKYNIDRYREGTLETLDVAALSELSDAAVPYLYELYQETDDVEFKASLRSAINGRYYDEASMLPYETTFRDFNLQTHQAEKIRAVISN
ncbi:DUF4173 domain-containing protein [Clostridiales bacterium BAD-6]|uniref:DUF4173 domain-containing protein n=2 Tax=Sinanaerobacter chloroacetimidivorans TaxID=2818044 RepID=A0A8J7W4G0_9FIRM|nr:DUF4173 domain-containing protein [Sinanaerobacter chloroacetimidivorans]